MSDLRCRLHGQPDTSPSAVCPGPPPFWDWWRAYRNCVATNVCLLRGELLFYDAPLVQDGSIPACVDWVHGENYIARSRPGPPPGDERRTPRSICAARRPLHQSVPCPHRSTLRRGPAGSFRAHGKHRGWDAALGASVMGGMFACVWCRTLAPNKSRARRSHTMIEALPLTSSACLSSPHQRKRRHTRAQGSAHAEAYRCPTHLVDRRAQPIRSTTTRRSK